METWTELTATDNHTTFSHANTSLNSTGSGDVNEGDDRRAEPYTDSLSEVNLPLAISLSVLAVVIIAAVSITIILRFIPSMKTNECTSKMGMNLRDCHRSKNNPGDIEEQVNPESQKKPKHKRRTSLKNKLQSVFGNHSAATNFQIEVSQDAAVERQIVETGYQQSCSHREAPESTAETTMESEAGLLTRLQPHITQPNSHSEETHPNSDPEKTAQHQRKISVTSQRVKLGERLFQEEEGKNDESCLLELPYRLHKVDSGFISGCSSLNQQKKYENLIQSVINKFKEDFTNGAVNVDTCYRTKHLAIGFFTPEDGVELKLEGCDKITLYIPQNALPGSKPQLVYMYLEMYEENLNAMSPRVNCGPDGLKFSEPAFLTLPHCAVDGRRLTLKSRENTNSEWGIDDNDGRPEIESIDGKSSTVTIAVHHFTGFGFDGDGPKRLGIAVYTRDDKARIYITPGYTRDVSGLMKFIEDNEVCLGFGTQSPWNYLIIEPGHGNLLIQATEQSSGQLIKKFKPIPESRLLSLTEFHMQELISETPDRNLVLDISLRQEGDTKNQYAQEFCIRLSGVSRPVFAPGAHGAQGGQGAQGGHVIPQICEPTVCDVESTEEVSGDLIEGSPDCHFHNKRGGECTCPRLRPYTKNARDSNDSAIYSNDFKFLPLRGPDYEMINNFQGFT